MQRFSEPERHPLKTARLRLEPTREAHAQRVYRDVTDPKLWLYFPDLRPKSLDDLQALYKRWERGNPDPTLPEEWENWVCFLADGDTPVGAVQATILPAGAAMVAYMIYTKYQGQGYAREAVGKLLEHLKCHHGVTRAIAEMDARNARSARLAESLGFERTRIRGDVSRAGGETAHEFVYELEL